MKLTTTFWSEKVHTFDNLCYFNNKTKEVMFKADLNNQWETYNFFKNIAKLVLTEKVRMAPEGHCYQFAVMRDNKIEPLKWFELHCGKNIISHDIAFSTTFIHKNDEMIPFGATFPKKKVSKYRELKMKARAYKYMANQVMS